MQKNIRQKNNRCKIQARECQNIEYKSSWQDVWGRGYKKIREGFEGAGLPMPKIENVDGGVKVTFQRRNANSLQIGEQTTQKTTEKVTNGSDQKVARKLPEIASVIMESIVGNNSVTIAELEMFTRLGHTTIKKVIREMQKENIIRRVGPDKGGHWEIINK